MDDYDPEEMKEKINKTPGRGEVWAYVKKTGATEKRFTGYDFEIHLCKSIWERIDMETRRYILDHELTHCATDLETGKFHIVNHDIQTFASDIARYGGKIKEVDALVENITHAHKAGRRERRREKENAGGSEE